MNEQLVKQRIAVLSDHKISEIEQDIINIKNLFLEITEKYVEELKKETPNLDKISDILQDLCNRLSYLTKGRKYDERNKKCINFMISTLYTKTLESIPKMTDEEKKYDIIISHLDCIISLRHIAIDGIILPNKI